ncbi:hypothetical protein SCHPADRAFT_817752 [Schizopora paradoxa]|uniref:Uncharacterized protein n=1 Tax=Schizopora paradoxa TaxID=27342 RepID=A0A0H2S6K3_9AGAM|nr:hypothetical protein SCHPADRAFT_817752 [Schizopora paradoxa]
MPSNITIDDSSTDIVYSSNWAAVNKNDPSLPEFFQSTYHGAQADEAYANLTFTGSSIYIYGTKGPSHVRISLIISRAFH